jgi:tetratricopeptide (TPR) repeat protein
MHELPAAVKFNFIYQLSVRARTYYDNKAYDEAIGDYTRAINLSQSTEATLFNNRANVYIEIGKFQDAILDLTQAIQLMPYVAVNYYNRAAVYLALNKIDLAIIDSHTAVRLNPLHVDFNILVAKLDKIKLSMQSIVKQTQKVPADLPINSANYQEHFNLTAKCSEAEYTHALSDLPLELEPLFSEITSYSSSDAKADVKAPQQVHSSYFPQKRLNPVVKLEDTKRQRLTDNPAIIFNAHKTYGNFFPVQAKKEYKFISVPNLEHETTVTCKIA